MKKLWLLAVASCVALLHGCGTSSDSLSFGPPPTQQAEEFGTGLETPPQSVRDTYPRALPPEVTKPPLASTIQAAMVGASPPPSVTIAVPPVQNQGHTGGCVSFATGYELISTVAAQGQNLTNLANCSSSAWGYLNALNLEGKACVVGSGNSSPGTLAASYLDTAVNVGAVSYAAIPFPSPSPIAVQVRELNAINATISQFSPSAQFQLGSWSVVDISVESLKSQLAAGQPMSIGINVPKGFDAYKGGVFNPQPQSPGGGHNIFLLGYDDSQQAFLVQNSWGTGWGQSGQCWWSYQSLVNFLIADGVHTAVPVSTEPIDPQTGSTGTVRRDLSFEVVRAHQAQSRDGRIYLVALVRLNPALRVEHYTLVSPSGRRARVGHGFMLRSGHLYLSRSDLSQWTPGTYTLEIVGLTPEGERVTASARLVLRALPGLPSADTPDGVTGISRQPVQLN